MNMSLTVETCDNHNFLKTYSQHLGRAKEAQTLVSQDTMTVKLKAARNPKLKSELDQN